MPFNKTILGLILVTGLLTFASTSSAQRPAPPPPAQGQQLPAMPAAPDQRAMGPGMGMGGGMMGGDMMTPGNMQTMGPILARTQGAGGRGQGMGAGNPIQMVSKLLAALDDTRVRTMIGLSDQQGDGLRKIVLDTETFTITTAASIAVNSLELRELLRADKPDRVAVMSKGDEISKSTSDLISHYLDALLAAKAVLTPEQQKMIRTYMESGAPAPPAPPALPARR
jgi:Spy/CpxP family protein refolding chaperone